MLVQPCHGFVARCVEDDRRGRGTGPDRRVGAPGRALLRDDDGGAAAECVVEERLRPVGIELGRRLVEEEQLGRRARADARQMR